VSVRTGSKGSGGAGAAGMTASVALKAYVAPPAGSGAPTISTK
jgi:hypothetical protein